MEYVEEKDDQVNAIIGLYTYGINDNGDSEDEEPMQINKINKDVKGTADAEPLKLPPPIGNAYVKVFCILTYQLRKNTSVLTMGHTEQ